MSSSFNSIHLVGNLGRDPELRYTPQGTPVCQFSIATNERFKKQGEDKQVTTWFRVTVFGRQAETVSQYLEKGRSCYVLGRLRIEEWTDRGGVVRTTLEVTADRVQFLGGNPDRESTEGMDKDASDSHDNRPAKRDDTVDDDIPF